MSSSPERLALLGVTGLLALLPLGGCVTRTVLDRSIVETHETADETFEFWDEVATRPVVTNNDALHGLMLLAVGDDMSGTYEDRVAVAQRKGWLAEGRSPPANESASLGMISMAICDILEIEGGLVMSLLGPSPERCTRELVYLGIVPGRSANQSLTGLEFADVVRRAADRGGPTGETP